MRYSARTLPVYVNITSRSKDPDLWLKRPRGNRYEADQIHVFEAHESFTNFPLLIDGSVHSVSLGSGCKPRMTVDSAVMWTYGHGFEVSVELLGNLVRKLTTGYRDTILRPTQGGDLLSKLAGDSTNGLVVIT